MDSVLIIGDTHMPAMRKGYVDFLKGVADNWGITRVVHIGDVVDWHSISYHEHSPSLHNPTTEHKRAIKQFRELESAFPKVDWLIGNHDALTERKCTSAGLPAKLLLKSYNELWETSWKVHDRFSEINIDGVIYSHGEGPGGQYAHGRRSVARCRSYVMGHLHSNAGVMWNANPEYRLFGLAVGCGVDNSRLQFLYGKPFPRKPILGCGVVVNGKQAYFEPMLLRSR